MKKVVSALLASTVVFGVASCSRTDNVLNPVLSQDNQANISSSNGILKEQRYTSSKLESVPGEILVALKEGRGDVKAAASKLSQKFNLQTVDSAPQLSTILLKADAKADLQSLIKKINEEADVQVAGPNYLYKMALSMNDPMTQDQYTLNRINAPQAWDITQGNANTVIAIVDTGIDLGHPDLKAKLVPGFSALKDKDTSNGQDKGGDDNGHGTHCAGIAAAIGNNGVGVAGIALNNKIMPVRVLGGAGSGSLFSIAKGVSWAANNGAKVISMSLGGPSSAMDLVVERSIKDTVKNDAVVVAAMGNSGKEENSVPAIFAAKYKNVIAVGATDSNDKKAPFSTWGSHITVGAPGVQILSTMPTYDVFLTKEYGISNNYAKLSGTSMATPAVSGVVGLMRSKFPNLKAEQIRAKLEKSVEDLGEAGFDKYFGNGRVDAFKAVSE